MTKVVWLLINLMSIEYRKTKYPFYFTLGHILLKVSYLLVSLWVRYWKLSVSIGIQL